MKSNWCRKILAPALSCIFAGLTAYAGQPGITDVQIESGSVVFEASTNVPGIEVKGKSTALSGEARVFREDNALRVEQIRVSLQVKSLGTGMKLRDEHMRKYI